MDKVRHPYVIRTWTVERTKVPYRQPQPAQQPPAKGRKFFQAPQNSGPEARPIPKAKQ